MSESSEPTHVLTGDCILPEHGRCEAGTMISESDVIPSTWEWLLQRGFLRSVEEIEAEADADDEGSETDGELSQQTEESASSEVVETSTNEATETATTVATVEGKSSQPTVTTETKPAGKKARKG